MAKRNGFELLWAKGRQAYVLEGHTAEEWLGIHAGVEERMADQGETDLLVLQLENAKLKAGLLIAAERERIGRRGAKQVRRTAARKRNAPVTQELPAWSAAN